MPVKKLAEFKVERLEILAPDGSCDHALKPDIPQEKLLRIYGLMIQARVFDEKAFKLQRQGRLGTYPQILGQEASQTVPPLCLEKKDWLIPTYRGQGCYFARGMPLKNSLLYWAGDDRGAAFTEGQNDMLFAIPVASHLTQAAGIAWGCRLKKETSVVLTYLGDGATSKGDFHESLTFAGLFKLPIIYLIENNQGAISLPRRSQTASSTLAQKAFGYGASGIQVDGNDVFALYRATEEAVARARKGEGPAVIEAETYRLGDHTTADEASRYRTPQEVGEWKKKDPISRLEKYLLTQGLLTETQRDQTWREAQEKVQTAIAEYEATPDPDPLKMFDHIFSELPWNLREQREELRFLLQSKSALQEDIPVEGRFP